MAFDIRNLIQPVAPGLSGAINPLAFIGAGMASGDMGAQLMRMGQLQQSGIQLAAQQQQMLEKSAETQRQMKAKQAMQAIAPGVAKELYPESPTVQALLASNPELMADLVKQRQKAALEAAKPPTATSAERIYTAMGGQQGTGKTFAEWYASDFKGAGTTVNVGPGDMGAVPQGMARIPDPESPTGTRLVMEPGAPPEMKAEQARQAKLAPLDTLEDSLARYRSVLEQYGPQLRAGEGAAALDYAYTDLLLKQKEAANLGALTGPDLDLMNRMMIDPTSIKAQVYDYLTGPAPMFGQLNQIQKTIDDAKARARGETPKRGDSGGAGPKPGDTLETFDLPDGGTARILSIEKVTD